LIGSRNFVLANRAAFVPHFFRLLVVLRYFFHPKTNNATCFTNLNRGNYYIHVPKLSCRRVFRWKGRSHCPPKRVQADWI